MPDFETHPVGTVAAKDREIAELKAHVAAEQLWRKKTTDYLAEMYGDFSRVAVTNEFLAAHDAAIWNEAIATCEIYRAAYSGKMPRKEVMYAITGIIESIQKKAKEV